MDTVTAAPDPIAPVRSALPELDMDEVCRELAECLAYIESLPHRYTPDGQPLEPPDHADAASERPPAAPHRAIPGLASRNSP